MADETPIQPRVIWLSPWCVGCNRQCPWSPDAGQLWCVDPQEGCEKCGLGWTRYTLDEAQAAEARSQQLPPFDPSA